MNPQYDLQIIIPAYNAEKYIEKCLNSILSQKTQYTYVITVINDGSTDETEWVANQYVQKHPEMFRLINKENGGHGSGINSGLEVYP